MRAQKYSFLDEYLKLQKNLIFFAFICIFVLTGGKNCVIIIVALGYSQAVRHQTLTLAFSLVRIQLSQPEKSTCASKCFFQLNPPSAEEIHLRWMKSALRQDMEADLISSEAVG